MWSDWTSKGDAFGSKDEALMSIVLVSYLLHSVTDNELCRAKELDPYDENGGDGDKDDHDDLYE